MSDLPHLSLSDLGRTIACPGCSRPVRANKNRVQSHLTHGGILCKWVGLSWRKAVNIRRLIDSEPKLVKAK